MTKSRSVIGFVGWQALCFAAAALGAIASADAPTFYRDLIRPSWAPPAWLFGPVWTILYCLMGIAAWLVWSRRGAYDVRKALALFVVQLAVNALWSWLFFAWHYGAASFAEIVLLWLLIAATTAAFARIRPAAAALLVPYWVWVSYAAALNYVIWRLNPAMLG